MPGRGGARVLAQEEGNGAAGPGWNANLRPLRAPQPVRLANRFSLAPATLSPCA